jgi:hypothetical protein
MQGGISQRIAERIALKTGITYQSNETVRTLNEDLIKMIGQIRNLEDEILAQQYKS